MEEVEKYTKLWDLPQGYGNNYSHPFWGNVVRQFVQWGKVQPDESILDVGGGDGRMKALLPRNRYTSLDLANNAKPDITADITTDLSEAGLGTYDYVTAIDVLEHLPLMGLDQALRNIRRMARKGAFFLIATRPDKGGAKIGQKLHLIVEDDEWWKKTLKIYWPNVQRTGGQKLHHVNFYVRGDDDVR